MNDTDGEILEHLLAIRAGTAAHLEDLREITRQLIGVEATVERLLIEIAKRRAERPHKSPHYR